MKQLYRVLFLCVHNAARSQMAEAFLNAHGKGRFYAESAGFEPGELNPHVVEVMREKGYDLSENSVDHVFDFYREGRFYGYVVTVCDESHFQKCPIFPGLVRTIHWDLPDPSTFEGTPEEIRDQIRLLSDRIEGLVCTLIEAIDQDGQAI